jgi:hypothetical protein
LIESTDFILLMHGLMLDQVIRVLWKIEILHDIIALGEVARIVVGLLVGMQIDTVQLGFEIGHLQFLLDL